MSDLNLFRMEQAGAILHAPIAEDSKYTRGVVGMVTGSEKYPGAAVLGVQAAARTGAGYICYYGPRRCQDAILNVRPETVFGVPAELAGELPTRLKANCWVMGSGIVGFPDSLVNFNHLGRFMIPKNSDYYPYFVIDAGALNWFTKFALENPEVDFTHCVLSPHFGEMSRVIYSVTGEKVYREAIERSPREWAEKIAAELGCTVILKGATTVISSYVHSHVETYKVHQRRHWLATAGTGDVLAGILGTIIAQSSRDLRVSSVRIGQVAAAAVYVHARAAEFASGVRKWGDLPDAQLRVGHPITALDVAESVPTVIEEILEQ